ncbi:MAG: Gfo/Idh/MocA family protein [Thermomicrobiales bacterium]
MSEVRTEAGAGTPVLRTIHVGVGGRGVWPVEVLGNDPKFRPVALVDVNQDFLGAAADRLGLPESACFTDLAVALQAVAADAVIICTPTRTHAALARLAFAAGKHVLVEKGMTLEWEEAQALVADAARADVKFCVAQNYRYYPVVQTVKRLLGDPADPHHPGQVFIVDCQNHRYRPEPRTLDYPYAMVWDMGCHHVDMLADWLGPVARVTAHSYNAPWSQYPYDANIAATLEYANGAICHYVLTHTATIGDWRIILQGERGALRLFDVPGVQFFPRPTRQLGQSQPQPCDVADGPRSEQGVADAFHRYITAGDEPGISGRQNLETLAVCELLVRAARDGRTVERAELD